jgi:hypothetical protein
MSPSSLPPSLPNQKTLPPTAQKLILAPRNLQFRHHNHQRLRLLHPRHNPNANPLRRHHRPQHPNLRLRQRVRRENRPPSPLLVHPPLPSPQHRRSLRSSIPRSGQPGRQAGELLPDGPVQCGVCDGAEHEHGEHGGAYEEGCYEWFVVPSSPSHPISTHPNPTNTSPLLRTQPASSSATAPATSPAPSSTSPRKPRATSSGSGA